MRILFIGDIMGRAGREALETYLPELKRDLEPDVVIVNGENAAHGKGITEKICTQFYDLGVDCITSGNHIWDQREIIPYIARDARLLRPDNFPKGTPGSGVLRLELQDGRVIVIVNLMARLFMDALDDPFAKLEEIAAENRLGQTCQALFVDFHGETTSEKYSLGHHFDSRVSAVIGTHTHAPTADAHIMSGGTAYMSDAGMSGDYDSVIGVRKDIAIHRFVRKMPGEPLIPASENKTLCGVFIVTNDNTGRAVSIEPVRLGDTLSNVRPKPA
ncbi:MAG: TIGR00282 family metallophosphoesterase [Alphaproteobacteria bacterium]|nr:TIGR00282 family metallophosphoesterase [Alphaproteobacteria bacterium]MCB9974745.1 TIGR00282 family metallophosphoesterase [Rhodospirillales bacterium]